MAIKAYSYAKDGNRKLSANFAVKEFRCKDGSDPIFIDDELVTLLQKIRDHFGKSVTITSAYRTAAHNKAVKGATYSQHCYGKAADIRVQGVGVEAVAAYAAVSYTHLTLPTICLCRDPTAESWRHRALSCKGGPPCWLGTYRHPRGKEPVGKLKVGGKQYGEHSESFSDGIP